MEGILVVILVIVLVIILIKNSGVNSRLERLQHELIVLQELTKRSGQAIVGALEARPVKEFRTDTPIPSHAVTEEESPALSKEESLPPTPYERWSGKNKSTFTPQPQAPQPEPEAEKQQAPPEEKPTVSIIPEPIIPQEIIPEPILPESTIEDIAEEPAEDHPVTENPQEPETYQTDYERQDRLEAAFTTYHDQHPTIQPAPAEQPEPPSFAIESKPGFFERNPDLEKFIGENLISKIGIAILVIAIGIFVKYAIDNDWIGPVGRVGIGLLCGGILVGLAHWLQKSYKAFSSVLIGGGMAIFYFSIALAYKDYALFGQTTAFAIMVVITAFAVAMSLLYDRQEVAIIALVGGFCVPFIVSNGSGNYVTLFIYLLVLNTGLLIIAYKKAWRLLNLLAFLFTILIYGGWLQSIPENAPMATYRNGLVFASIFYILFTAINIAHNVKQQKKFIASDFGIILGNTALYFSAGLSLIYGMHAEHYVGLFSGSMGAFNLILCFLLYRNANVDKNVLYLLIGITLTFISLTIPLQLHGHFITLFWASEAVVLYWLYQRSKIPLTRITSMLIWVFMLLSLIMDWSQIYVDEHPMMMIMLNKGFITTLVCAISSYCMFRLRKQEENQEQDESDFYLPKQLLLITALALLYVGGLLELFQQISTRYPGNNILLLYEIAYTYTFMLALDVLAQRGRLASLPTQAFRAILSLMVLSYLISLPVIFETLSQLLLHGTSQAHFITHWVAASVIGLIIYRILSSLRRDDQLLQEYGPTLTWVSCSIVVIFFSCELNLLMYQLFYKNPESLEIIHRVFIKTGLPIIWGLCSFSFMWLGMRYKYRPMRIVSLTLFLITLLKLFIFDIQNIPVAGKIAAFFCLGVLLLVVSFMYQRLKKIITDDAPKNEE